MSHDTITSAIEAHSDPAHEDSPQEKGLPLDKWASDWSAVRTSTLPEIYASGKTSIATSLRAYWPDPRVSPGGGASTVAGDPGFSASQAGRR